MGSPGKGKGKAKATKPDYFSGLPPDALERVALLLPSRDRFKLNLVCRAWRGALEGARPLWEEVWVDPRKGWSTSRRVRYNKSLPTPAALGAWFERYGRHVRRLHLRHLDAASQQEGCVDEEGVASLLRIVAPGLQQLSFNQCAVQSLLDRHTAELCSLQQLTALHLQTDVEGRGLSLGTPRMAFISRLARLQDLALATPFRDDANEHFLPASLAALPHLRSLQLVRLPEQEGDRGPVSHGGAPYVLSVASCLTGLSSLQRLAVSDFLLVEEEPVAEAPDELRMPPALWALQLTSLHLSAVGLGRQLPPPQQTHLRGLYPMPAALSQLAPTLRELALLEHTCAAEEIAVLSSLTGLTALRLTARLRARAASPVPDALSCLTGLQQLRISHGLGQVPPAIVGLSSLTLLDLSYNRLHSLKPGPYLKKLVAVNLRANEFKSFPQQLRVARQTAQELQLPQNDSMAISERDLEQLLTFDNLRQLTLFGASEDKTTRRCLAALQKAMPWLLIDV